MIARLSLSVAPDVNTISLPESALIRPAIVSRAIRLAARRPGNVTLTPAELLELLDLDRPRVEDRLRDLEAALIEPPKLFRALLAIGCHQDRGELVDDWFACHSEALLAMRDSLRAMLDVPSWNLDHGAQVRSAIEFLLERCKRVGIELELTNEIDELDRRLAARKVEGAPWGIPATHTWW